MLKGSSRTIATIFMLAMLLSGMLSTPAHAVSDFRAYDLTHYSDSRVNLPEDAGFTRANIIVPPAAWKSRIALGLPPDEASVRAAVNAESDPGPIVFDIEDNFYLDTNDRAVAVTRANIAKQILQWAKDERGDKEFGLYGYLNRTFYANLDLAIAVAQHEDMFFPEMYTRTTSFNEWHNRLVSNTVKAADIDPVKPIVPFLWPQYYPGTKDTAGNDIGGQFVPGTAWRQQLNDLSTHAEGVTIWSLTVPVTSIDWYNQTVDFMATLP